MNQIIIDAGPCLNLLATNNERVLLAVVNKRLAAPETVRSEVHDKSRADRVLAPAWPVWMKLEKNDWISVLSDDNTAELEAAANLVINTPLAQRKKQAKDLGETMVVIHAVSLATAGEDVSAIIDDRDGAKLATAQAQRLARLQAQGRTVGALRLYGTHSILEQAVAKGAIADKAGMRKIYGQLRTCDAGLVHITQTHLLSDDVWC